MVANSIRTEIEVLKSPSVLIDIFEFVKNQANNKEKSNSKFDLWIGEKI